MSPVLQARGHQADDPLMPIHPPDRHARPLIDIDRIEFAHRLIAHLGLAAAAFPVDGVQFAREPRPPAPRRR
jgi:hypothetical protein